MKKSNVFMKHVTKAAAVRYPYGKQAICPSYWSERRVMECKARLEAELGAEWLLIGVATIMGIALFVALVYLEAAKSGLI